MAGETDVFHRADFAALFVLEPLGQATSFNHPEILAGIRKAGHRASECTTEETREDYTA
jgi:hypothetical protein